MRHTDFRLSDDGRWFLCYGFRRTTASFLCLESDFEKRLSGWETVWDTPSLICSDRDLAPIVALLG